MSLALVGQAALSERIGRNARFASIGNGLAAGVMGIAGSYLPAVSVFLVRPYVLCRHCCHSSLSVAAASSRRLEAVLRSMGLDKTTRERQVKQ